MRHQGCASIRDNKAQSIPEKKLIRIFTFQDNFEELPVIKTIFLPKRYLKICPHSSTHGYITKGRFKL